MLLIIFRSLLLCVLEKQKCNKISHRKLSNSNSRQRGHLRNWREARKICPHGPLNWPPGATNLCKKAIKREKIFTKFRLKKATNLRWRSFFWSYPKQFEGKSYKFSAKPFFNFSCLVSSKFDGKKQRLFSEDLWFVVWSSPKFDVKKLRIFAGNLFFHLKLREKCSKIFGKACPP